MKGTKRRGQKLAIMSDARTGCASAPPRRKFLRHTALVLVGFRLSSLGAHRGYYRGCCFFGCLVVRTAGQRKRRRKLQYLESKKCSTTHSTRARGLVSFTLFCFLSHMRAMDNGCPTNQQDILDARGRWYAAPTSTGVKSPPSG